MQKPTAFADTRTAVTTCLLSLIAGNATAIGFWLKTQGDLFGNVALLTVLAIALSAAFLVGLSLLWTLLNKLEERRSAFPPTCFERKRQACAIAAAIIFACWIPVLLGGWPGYFSYDSGLEDPLMQWAQIESGTLNAHHSILHTFFLAGTVFAGEALFGSFNAGICTSVVIQALIVAATFGFVLKSLLDNGLGKAGFLASTAYFALHPIVSLFAFCTTKDTLFSAAAIAFCFVTLSLYRTSTSASPSERKRLMVALVLLGFVLCVLRANAIIALIVFTPFIAFLVGKPARRTFIASMGVALALAAFWLVPISTVLGVEPSPIGKWNALGIPMQQIARCEHDASVSAEDRETIQSALGNIEYKQNNSDYARDPFCYREGGSREIAGLYLSLGLKYPAVYLEAALLHTEDAWSPFAVIDAYDEPGDGVTSVFDFRTMKPGHMEPLLPAIHDALFAFCALESAAETPGMGLLTSIAIYLFAMLVCLARGFTQRNRALMCFCLPLAILALSNLCGPCMLIRYFLYLFYALPAFLFFLVNPPHKVEA